MLFDNRDKRDLLREREPLLAEVLEEGFEGLYPGAAYREEEPSMAREAPQEIGHLFLVIQRDGTGLPKIHRCEEAQEAQIFLEGLLSQGVNREDIELFRAARTPFSVSYRPVVNFQAG